MQAQTAAVQIARPFCSSHVSTAASCALTLAEAVHLIPQQRKLSTLERGMPFGEECRQAKSVFSTSRFGMLLATGFRKRTEAMVPIDVEMLSSRRSN